MIVLYTLEQWDWHSGLLLLFFHFIPPLWERYTGEQLSVRQSISPSILSLFYYFCQRFLNNDEARTIIFGIRVNDDRLCGDLYIVLLSLFCLCLIPQLWKIKLFRAMISLTSCILEVTVIISMQIDDSLLIMRVRTSLLPFLVPCICPIFMFS